MQFDTSRICHHCSQPDLISKLLSALERAGKDIDSLSRDDVAGFEEFHIRSRDATCELARLANLQPEMEVLDIGSGIGGPARTLAAEFGCRVTGLDLVEGVLPSRNRAHKPFGTYGAGEVPGGQCLRYAVFRWQL